MSSRSDATTTDCSSPAGTAESTRTAERVTHRVPIVSAPTPRSKPSWVVCPAWLPGNDSSYGIPASRYPTALYCILQASPKKPKSSVATQVVGADLHSIPDREYATITLPEDDDVWSLFKDSLSSARAMIYQGSPTMDIRSWENCLSRAGRAIGGAIRGSQAQSRAATNNERGSEPEVIHLIDPKVLDKVWETQTASYESLRKGRDRGLRALTGHVIDSNELGGVRLALLTQGGFRVVHDPVHSDVDDSNSLQPHAKHHASSRHWSSAMGSQRSEAALLLPPLGITENHKLMVKSPWLIPKKVASEIPGRSATMSNPRVAELELNALRSTSTSATQPAIKASIEPSRSSAILHGTFSVLNWLRWRFHSRMLGRKQTFRYQALSHQAKAIGNR